MADVHPPPALISRRINAERLVLFGWSRAILMQLAHPLLAAGVAEHSTFRAGPFIAARRLHGTVRAMLALTFGSDRRQIETIDAIRAIHRRVNGRLRAPVGTFAAGTPYSAEDPDLVLWVHATLLESIPAVYEMLVGPLSAEERDVYCEEVFGVAVALGADPARVPRTMGEMRTYLDGMLTSGVLAVGGDAQALADAVLAPPLRFLTGPIARANRTIAVGLLPNEIRAAYGFTWSIDDARRFERNVKIIRGVRRVLPPFAALWPEARRRA